MNDDLLNKFSEILKEKNIDPNTIFNNTTQSTVDSSQTGSTNHLGNIDLDTIMKIKTLLNSGQDQDTNSNLLLALKPYMRESRKNKIDQYAQILKYIKIFKALQKQGGDK